jgi:hypothetical protein
VFKVQRKIRYSGVVAAKGAVVVGAVAKGVVVVGVGDVVVVGAVHHRGRWRRRRRHHLGRAGGCY